RQAKSATYDPIGTWRRNRCPASWRMRRHRQSTRSASVMPARSARARLRFWPARIGAPRRSLAARSQSGRDGGIGGRCREVSESAASDCPPPHPPPPGGGGRGGGGPRRPSTPPRARGGGGGGGGPPRDASWPAARPPPPPLAGGGGGGGRQGADAIAGPVNADRPPEVGLPAVAGAGGVIPPGARRSPRPGRPAT